MLTATLDHIMAHKAIGDPKERPKVRWREKMKLLGRCVVCGLQAELGKTRCSHHLGKNRKEWGKRKTKLIAKNLCIKCGIEKMPGDGSRCSTCLQRHNLNRR